MRDRRQKGLGELGEKQRRYVYTLMKELSVASVWRGVCTTASSSLHEVKGNRG